GLQALVDQAKARRLAALGGTEPDLRAPRRRRTA
ncbi:MAG: type II toxin-antitoxin system VapB family antitoxin, partial [Acidimicrobiia bacterium]